MNFFFWGGGTYYLLKFYGHGVTSISNTFLFQPTNGLKHTGKCGCCILYTLTDKLKSERHMLTDE